MKRPADPNNPELTKNGHYRGYTIERIEKLMETGALFYELRHLSTGARHIHISSEDRENTFGVVFKTVPKNSTGVAHILEHTVLCGSEKFPVRDPFFSMLKRSLSTFMNAFTASDWTMYPFSTQNRKDFYNLMDVYLDAVFFPKLDDLSFKQEGHRLEIENREKGGETFHLQYKGVVYNEMKGAMSSPHQVMGRALLKSLYPSTTYRYNSGGEPAVIPSLTYEQLKSFHRDHYHPSNAYFYTYGNLPLETHLSFVEDKILKHFVRIEPDTDVASQPRWKQPRRFSQPYPLADNEDPSKKSQICIAWLTTDIKDTFEVLVLALLEQILLGNPASPLRKALIESQIGTALCDSAGFDADNRDSMFVCGLKDVEAGAAEKIETLIFNVLQKLADQGIDKALIESAIHQIEFHRREITNTPYPYGIKLLLAMAGTWIHGGDPLHKLQLDEDLKKLRRQLARESFFEKRIKKYFLNNPHRVLFSLVPDPSVETRESKRVADELEQVRKGLKSPEVDRIVADAEALVALQEAEEDVSILPTLTRKDIPIGIQRIAETDAVDAMPAINYAYNTSGIFYYAAAAGAGRLDDNLIPLVPFFCFAFPKVGTAMHEYTDMAQRIDLYTGGITLSTHARTGFDSSGNCVPFVSFNGKCLNRNREHMFEIVAELIHQPSYSDCARLKNLLLEYRAALESMVVGNGHRLAISLASRNLSVTSSLGEIWSGVHQLQTIKRLTDNLSDEQVQHIAETLRTIHGQLFFKRNLKTALIGDEDALSAAEASLRSLYTDFADVADGKISPDAFSPPALEVDDRIIREGWSTSTAVSFVAQSFATVRMAHEDAPALSVISRILRSMYLHREIREKGGAYGGFSLYNPEDGLFCFASYRDPHIVSTLNVYKKAADFICSDQYRQEDVDEAILQVCADIDKPDPPGPAARKAFYRKIIFLSDDARQHYKSRILELTRKRILQAAVKYFGDGQQNHPVAVISSEDRLKAANDGLADPLTLNQI